MGFISALEPIFSSVIEEEFIKLKSDFTIILVTHILCQAKRLADNVVLCIMEKLLKVAWQNKYLKIRKQKSWKNICVLVIKIVGGKRLSKTEPLFSKSGFFI